MNDLINGHRITHKGWYGFCPVYIAEAGDKTAHIAARNWLLNPVLDLSLLLMWLFCVEGWLILTGVRQ